MNRPILLFILVAFCFAGVCSAQAPSTVPAPAKVQASQPSKEAQVPAKPVDPVVLSNQMMIVAGERIKAGALAEAKEIANDMIYGCEKYASASLAYTKSFSSLMGKKLYEDMMRREGRQEPVIWLQQPIADGFYFLAIIAFEEKKPAEALRFIEKAIDWDPVRSAFYVERGFIQVNSPGQKTIAEVAASYLKALELADGTEDFAAALRGLGYLYIEQNDWEGALAAYLVSMFYDPQNPAAKKEIDFIRFHRPEVYKNLDGNKASQVLARRQVPVKIDPIHVQILLQVADGLSPTKQAKELMAVLKRALALDPKNEAVRKRLAEVK